MISELWTYSLSDFLPFSRETWLRLFELYNAAIWPLPIIFTLAGLILVWRITQINRTGQQQPAIALLVLVWVWVGWQFHWTYYATLNWAATYMAIAFFVQAGLLALSSVLTERVRFRFKTDLYSRLGVLITLFALFVQPLLGLWFDRDWHELASFGATPDPTVVATLGLLLLARGHLRWVLLPIPVLWCTLSSATAFAMPSAEGVIPALAALLVLLLIIVQSWHKTD